MVIFTNLKVFFNKSKVFDELGGHFTANLFFGNGPARGILRPSKPGRIFAPCRPGQARRNFFDQVGPTKGTTRTKYGMKLWVGFGIFIESNSQIFEGSCIFIFKHVQYFWLQLIVELDAIVECLLLAFGLVRRWFMNGLQ